jgi:hypothetical protein
VQLGPAAAVVARNPPNATTATSVVIANSRPLTMRPVIP